VRRAALLLKTTSCRACRVGGGEGAAGV
jgi:hypothetical protein